jgi:superfamily II DNA or RNA helicase
VEIIKVTKLNEVYNKIECEPGIGYELNDFFTFEVPGAKFMPAYKNKVWDGKIRLYNLMTSTLYGGLLPYVEDFCEKRKYRIEYGSEFSYDNFSINEAKKYIKSLNLPEKFVPRDYQIDALVHAIRSKRAVLLSPTASGKSFIIYLLIRYYSKKTLVIVPTTTLVHQMTTDFEDYGYDKNIHKIYSGQTKDTEEDITVTTWQSIYKMPKEWFDQFDVVIGDEAHTFKAKSLTSIMTNLEECKYRFGFTGTLDGTQTHKLVLEGLFGPVQKVITTAELIEQKHVSQFKIKAIVLDHPKEVKDAFKKVKGDKRYQTEMDYIVQNTKRNKFIKNLALSLEGNTLVLFQYVKHGKELHNMITDEADCKTFFVHGGVEGSERDKIREIVEQLPKSVICASFGTFSTGINIPSIQNIIFATSYKSKVRNLQSIGRGLRKSTTKTSATLFDITDDLSTGKSLENKNILLRQFMERIKTYNEEQFSYKIYKVTL